MHDILLKIHVWSNVVFTIIAIVLLFLIIKGLIKKQEYKSQHVFLEKSYLILLYLGLFFGILLYFVINKEMDLSNLSIEELQKRQNSKFWAVEHFSVMVFALLIAQIGKLFTSKSITDKQKFKYALFYYGSSSGIILVSMFFYLYYKLQ